MNSEREIVKRLFENEKMNTNEPNETLDEKTYTVGDTQYWKRGGKTYKWCASKGREECSEDEYYKAISGGTDNPVKNTEPKEDKAKQPSIPKLGDEVSYKGDKYIVLDDEDKNTLRLRPASMASDDMFDNPDDGDAYDDIYIGTDQLDKPKTTTSSAKVSGDDAIIDMNGHQYKATADGMSSEDLVKKYNDIAKHSPGRAIQWIKKNGKLDKLSQKSSDTPTKEELESARKEASELYNSGKRNIRLFSKDGKVKVASSTQEYDDLDSRGWKEIEDEVVNNLKLKSNKVVDRLKSLNFNDIPDYGISEDLGDYSIEAFVTSSRDIGDHMTLEVFDKNDKLVARLGDIQSQNELDSKLEDVIDKVTRHSKGEYVGPTRKVIQGKSYKVDTSSGEPVITASMYDLQSRLSKLERFAKENGIKVQYEETMKKEPKLDLTKPSRKASRTPELTDAEVDKYAGEWTERSGDDILDNAYSDQRVMYAKYIKANEAEKKLRKSIEDKVRRDLGLPPRSKDRKPLSGDAKKAMSQAMLDHPKFSTVRDERENAMINWENSVRNLKSSAEEASAMRGVKVPRDYIVAASEWDDAD